MACQGGTPNCSNTTAGANQYGVLVVDPTKPTTTSPAWTTTAGYDNATGLGSLNVTNLLGSWASATFTADTVAITSPATNTVNIKHGATVNFTVTVTGAGTPTGAVSLIAKPTGSPQVGIGSFSQGGTFTLSGTPGTVAIPTNILPGGTSYPVVANYGGDGTFAPGTSPSINVTVTPESSITTVSPVTIDSAGNPTVITGPTSLPYGSPYILQIAVTDSNGNLCAAVFVGCPTGKVTLTDNGAAQKDFSGTNSTTLNSQGFLEDQPVQLPAGANSLVATYAGDNSYTGSTSAAEVVTITAAPTTISVASSAPTVAAGKSVTLTATIGTQSSGVGPTGTVTFSVNGTALTPVAVVPMAAVNTGAGAPASATATLAKSFTASGTESITATYTTGDGNYTGSGPSTAVTVTVTGGLQATTTAVTSSSTSIVTGGSVTLTATVTGTTDNVAGPTGTVQFMNGSSALGAAATCTPAAGTASTPGTCTATLMTTLSLLTPPSGPSQRMPSVPLGPLWIVASLMLILFLLSLKRLPMAKRVGYACAGVVLFACVAAGIAGCGSSGGGGGTTTPPHTDSITAVYSGDTSYTGSTSTALSITVSAQ